jgi:hypothetical protein
MKQLKFLEIYDELYKVQLLLCWGGGSSLALKDFLCDRYPEVICPDNLDDRKAGYFFVYPDKDDDEVYGLWVLDKKDLGCLVHEVNHMCLFLFRERGINAQEGDSEPFCYYSEKLFNNFVELFKSTEVHKKK